MYSKLSDPDPVRNDQYKDSSNLYARANLHQRFSTNETGWHEWVYAHFDFPEKTKILEVGSGPGYLWQHNKNSLCQQDICLSDISIGMLAEARTALGSHEQFRFTAHDICRIPFADSFFDSAIANHMLYHVPDLPAALIEIKRVLRPGGCLYAATNGPAHMKEIPAWKSQFFPDLNADAWETPTHHFNLDNGRDLLSPYFKEIRLVKYPDHLEVTQADDLIRYIQSYSDLKASDPGYKLFRKYLENQIARAGSIRIEKESGLFIAIRD